MNLTEYLLFTNSTAVYPGMGTGNPDELSYLCFGLIGEYAEWLECDGEEEILKEAGDVYWYGVRLIFTCGNITGNSWLSALQAELEKNPKLLNVVDGQPFFNYVENIKTVAESCKKYLRDDNEYKLGDIYLSTLLILKHVTFTTGDMQEILDTNVNKLSSRKARGVIQGDGDNR